ncbi:class I SAM-dependent methyltransferase [[Limnothrix rosea] IAM M-220]|uniref:class I SAM-dependent methyltransferase n=1 Tax=[Limnothrix rosea] IAM M-220 TaxID=454133 RepID=UPI0009676E1E|nr:class I SAM-dependent methyltransferase [[Limnothrix rosea] IAM M-220]OKH18561.1 SAM-dependent methyltransferase [[Limnothrix rosea] IAM M-220]
MSQSTKFWDKIAAKYAEQPIEDEESYQKKLEITRGYFNPEMELLEIGCGTGSTAILHAPHVKHIRAVDFSKEMLAIAQQKASEQNIQNITFEQCSVEELNVPKGSMDMVLALSILHLLEDKEAAIAKIYTMLKAGGLLVTSTMCLGDEMGWFKLIAPMGKVLGFFPLVKVFTVENLVESLTKTGFSIDYQWQPDKKKAVFIVAKKTA